MTRTSPFTTSRLLMEGLRVPVGTLPAAGDVNDVHGLVMGDVRP